MNLNEGLTLPHISVSLTNPSTFFNFPDKSSVDNMEVLTVNATDIDSDNNAKIHYSIVHPVPGFSIGEFTGVIYANTSRLSKSHRQDVQLSISATDSGTPPLRSVASVRIYVTSSGIVRPQFLQNQYR